MNAGLPGTGLGGLLYLVLALLMPLRELYLTARGRSSRERWRAVLRQTSIALGIVAAMVATGWLVTRLSDSGPQSGPGGASLLLAPGVVAAAVLAVLVVTLRVWSFVLEQRSRPTH